MRPDLPSLTALQSFEAALRHRSFSRAGNELHRTQGAISRQVAALEDQLGVLLFHREHPRVRPTPAAVRYGAQVRAILDRLAAATLEAQSTSASGGLLHLAILPTFGTRWLIPRIPDFYRLHSDVRLELSTRLAVFDFEVELLDAAIHYGEPTFPGARLDHLMTEEVLVVCTPSFAEKAQLAGPADLIGQPLLQLRTRPGAWRDWFATRDLTAANARAGAVFEHHMMIVQAALAGLGVALMPAFLVMEELDSGRLIEPFPESRLRTEKAYWLAYPDRTAALPAFRTFRKWLLARLTTEGLTQ